MEMEQSGYNEELERWLVERAELLKRKIMEELMRRKEGRDLKGALQWPELNEPIVEIFDTLYQGRIGDLVEPNKLDFPLL